MSIPSVRDSKKCLTKSSRGMTGSCDCCSSTIIIFLKETEAIITLQQLLFLSTYYLLFNRYANFQLDNFCKITNRKSLHGQLNNQQLDYKCPDDWQSFVILYEHPCKKACTREAITVTLWSNE
jgi:hypothetical protein